MPNITFLTTQSFSGSTVIGRVLPLARYFAKTSNISLIVHESEHVPKLPENVDYVIAGRDPFHKTPDGKKRLSGIALILRLLVNTLRATWHIYASKPETLIICKSLPENVLAARLYRITHKRTHIILDVDDFELTANTLTSAIQRASIGWAERVGISIADQVVVATPFLKDHFSQLAPDKSVTLIPTGLLKEQIATPKPTTNKVLLYFGSISISSGHRVDTLPEVLEKVRKKVPDAELVLAGDGDDVESLKSEFKRRGLSDVVTWTGRFAPESIPTMLAGASIVLDPVDTSLTNRAKSTSRTLMAAASQIPVVTSNVGIRAAIIPQSLHDRFFADANSVDDYASRIVDLFLNPLRVGEKEMLASHAMRYTWDVLAEEYRKLLI